MRPSVEHAIRIGYFKNTLKLPFSLFLENVWDNRTHTVLVVKNHDDKDRYVTVRNWNIANINKKRNMPSCKENIILKEDLFESKFTILEDYKPLEYNYEFYEFLPEPNGCNTQEWVEEEQEEYRHLLNRIYFSIEHQMRREETLWHNFMNGFMSKSYNLFLKAVPIDIQQCLMQEASPKQWKNWILWRNYILDFYGKVAPELVFYEAYEKKLKQNIKYQEFLDNKSKKLLEDNVCCNTVFTT